MTYTILPLTEDPWQVFTMDLSINDEPFHAQVEIRYMPAPDQWYLTIRDHSSGELLVNGIPVVCSYFRVNDLLGPFRHLRNGKGLGSLFCMCAADAPGSTDPSEGNLTQFRILWGDTFDSPP